MSHGKPVVTDAHVVLRVMLIATLGASACAPKGACESDVDALEHMMQELPANASGLWLRAETETIALLADEVPGREEVHVDAVTLYVTKIGVTGNDLAYPSHLDDQHFVGTASIEEATRDLEVFESGNGDGARPMLLVVQLDAPWRQIEVVLEALRSRGHRSVDVLFRRARQIPPAPTPSSPLSLDPEVRQLDRAGVVARELEPLAERCPAIRDLVESVAQLRGRQVEAGLIAGLGPALRSCHCAADPETLGAIVHYFVAPQFVPAVVSLALPVVAKPSPEAPWSEVFPLLLEGNRSEKKLED